MSLVIILVWIILVTSISLFGAWYAKKYGKPDGIIGLYVTFVLISNLIAFKISEYNFGFITLYATAASIIFPVTFLLTDVVNEKFGRKETHRMIFIAFIAQVATAVFIFISIYLSPAPFWADQNIFQKVFGFAPRVMLASWISFLISENVDAYIFAWFKKLTKGKHLWSRNVFSSIPAMALDTIIFVTLAFYGVQPLAPLITGVLIIKWIVGIIDIPFMYLNRKIMD
ncbi:Putative vitamin uptake transporter [uncultured archaeon]|nr:Putative vitamin uptake transporter [uncultured archaeon]